ncbi:mannose-6-phosphate isomerase, class I [Salipaludibacillus daqingensis]|uniref:mannose-6-phosphate isomerase, class I n=1 Tax=Salipaludibacillus daqingensis TaxID=3041001 RepID=UPI002476AA8A|nr:mannose-6-phosphate isomerase, class I [Salipaludibacillus daqingensis]
MTKDILLLEPVLKEKIWGGTKLKSMFGYDIPSEQTGECWGISGHENGSNTVANGPFKGKTVRQLWEQHRDLFANEKGEEFPLLVKIIDAQDDLSVQVHPDDQYAKDKEGYDFGKTECWYILDSDPGAELVLGHTASSREELEKLVNNHKWEDLFLRVPVEVGNFVYVPSGTVHAIGSGVLLLEIQQSSDITYRFYDYDRPGQDGEMRELHIEDSIACSMVPHRDALLDRPIWEEEGLTIERLIKENYFTVHRWTLEKQVGTLRRMNHSYQLVSVIDGAGQIQTEESVHLVKKGDHFIVPSHVDHYEMNGDMTLVVSETTK